MKAMILAIRLKYFYLTYKGTKTEEIRKTAPKNFVGDVYEYVSKTNFEKELQEIPENEREFFKQFKGKVGLKFTLRKVEELEWETENLIDEKLKGIHFIDDRDFIKTCLTYEEYESYLEEGKTGYAYHIEDLVIFDKPKELSDFYKWCEPFEINKGCRKARWEKSLTKAPQSYCYVESEE